MPYANKQQQKEFQREWCRKRRALWLAIYGGECWKCGSTNELQFDHVDASTKVTHRLWSRSHTAIGAELAKCQLLCRHCHYLKTCQEKGWDPKI